MIVRLNWKSIVEQMLKFVHQRDHQTLNGFEIQIVPVKLFELDIVEQIFPQHWDHQGVCLDGRIGIFF